MDKWNRIIDFLTRISSAVPILIMAVLFLLAVFNVTEISVLRYAEDFGLSTIVFIPLASLYYNRKFKFCLLTKCMLFGLIINHLLYKIGAYIRYDVYSNWYTINCAVFSMLLFLIILYSNKKKK